MTELSRNELVWTGAKNQDRNHEPTARIAPNRSPYSCEGQPRNRVCSVNPSYDDLYTSIKIAID